MNAPQKKAVDAKVVIATRKSPTLIPEGRGGLPETLVISIPTDGITKLIVKRVIAFLNLDGLAIRSG